MTFKAIAYKTGYRNSSITSAFYSISGKCTNPIFSHDTGFYNEPIHVTISSEIPDSSIKYYIADDDTFDGVKRWKNYSEPILIESSSKIYAQVQNTGWADSGIVSTDLSIRGVTGELHCTLIRDSEFDPVWVVLECDTPNATITTNFGKYFGPFFIKDDLALEATAKRGDFSPSNTIKQELKIKKKPIITFTPIDTSTAKVIITTLDNVQPMIIYTIDGSEPSVSNGILYSGPFTINEGITVKAISIINNIPSNTETCKYNKALIAPRPTIVSTVFGTSNDSRISIGNYSEGYYVKYDHQRHLAGAPSLDSTKGSLFEHPFIYAKYDSYSYVGFKSGYIELPVIRNIDD